jgi:hypothetical protein
MALLTAGALGVHQLRYAVGFGDDAGQALAAQGHSYLAAALPMATAFAVVALASIALGLSRGGASEYRSLGLLRLWISSALCLALVFAIQESAEGIIAAGHPAGAAAFLGGSAWTGLALSVPVGLLIALILRGADDTAGARVAIAPPHFFLPVLQGLTALRGAVALATGAAHARGPPASA